jgi:hexosaminidase
MVRFALIFLTIIYFCLPIVAQDIFPKPVEMTVSEKRFTIDSKTPIGYNTVAAMRIATVFQEKFARASGIELDLKLKGKIQFNINAIANERIGNEGYTLEINDNGITINANHEQGLFYGLQTLLQLLPKEIESKTIIKTTWQVKQVKIVDYPRFGWRGLMLDVSRHFFTKAEVKKYIDYLAQYKMNTFHWHLSDDEGWRIEIKALPLLTQVGACRAERFGKWGNHTPPTKDEPKTACGYYTQEDIKEIVQYAAERFVTIVPEIDVPGHSMAAIAAYPELCCTKDSTICVSVGQKFSEWYENGTFKMLTDNTLNPANEKVYEFLDKVFTEVAALFPGKYIHTGGDECYYGYWEKDPSCIALMQKEQIKTMHELQGYFLNRVEKIIQAKGKKIIGWDEILEGGISNEAVVMSWRGIKGGIEAAKKGNYVVMSPNDYLYIDLIQGDKLSEPDAMAYKQVRLKKAYQFEPISEDINPKYVLGGQANLWTEKVPTFRHAEYMMFPRTLAVADIFWSPKGKDWDNFTKRMESQMQRWDIANINYARSAFEPIATPKLDNQNLIVEISSEVNGLDFYYTIDETTPDLYAQKYVAPILLPEGNDVTLKVVAYRNTEQMGKMIAFPRELLLKRVKK